MFQGIFDDWVITHGLCPLHLYHHLIIHYNNFKVCHNFSLQLKYFSAQYMAKVIWEWVTIGPQKIVLLPDQMFNEGHLKDVMASSQREE